MRIGSNTASVVLAVATLTAVAACGTPGSNASAKTAPTSAARIAAATTIDTPGVASALAPWQTITLTDNAGAKFAFADFVGRPVLVENFATWCSECRH